MKLNPEHDQKSFYLTTTLPYVNADPHIGFALEIIQADVIARYKKLIGHDVFFNTGTDEHGLKIYQKAFELGEETESYVNRYVERFRNLKDVLSLSDDLHFIRTTDEHHIRAAQEFWSVCKTNGYIYKKKYKTRYCVGCELERSDTEIVNGHCFLHPHLELVIIEEDNYFFKFSSFQKQLLALYENQPDFVVPSFRFNEIKAFVARGLEDFSISRLKSKMPWGVPVPDDSDHVMYVWFDALVNYISTLGWPDDSENFLKWWPVVQFAGKDNLRQQSAMWQAMLMAVGLPPSRRIVIHGFITSDGKKMSKSLGNVVDPVALVKEFGTDALRYYLLREVSPFEDSDFKMEKFKETYNANLSNGLGNLVSRVMKMAAANLDAPVAIAEREDMSGYFAHLEKYEFNKAADYIWKRIGEIDSSIQVDLPFKVVKTDKKKGQEIIQELVVKLYSVARMLHPLMPQTSAEIKKLIQENKMPEAPLFPRKD